MKPAEYLALRERVIAAGHDDEIEWSEGLKPPTDAYTFASEYVWVVLNSGMKGQVARIIADRVYPAIEAGKSAGTVFRHQAKVRAIDAFWKKRGELFDAFAALATDAERFAFTDPKGLRKRLGVAPSIGKIVRWHLAKNWGIDCAKPDRHLERIAAHYRTTAHDLCAALARATGDRVATVDLVLWRASNLGFIDTKALATP